MRPLDLNPEDVQSCLQRIFESKAFSGSPRLQDLLRYVVSEELAGRGELIRAKTIGLDVHKYSPDEISDREGAVRVDAGRVRRKLEEYYQDAGASDSILIALPVGTYRPALSSAPRTAEPEPENG